jgi:hypothetical protein
VKSLEVTVILVAKTDGVALVHERYIARHCQQQTYGALRVVAVQERFKSLALPVLNLRRASRRIKVLPLMRHKFNFLQFLHYNFAAI